MHDTSTDVALGRPGHRQRWQAADVMAGLALLVAQEEMLMGRVLV